MLAPLVVLELVAFWPLVFGVFVLLLRRRLVGVVERASHRSFDAVRQQALNRAVVCGGLLLIDIGLGATVWSYASAARPLILVVAVVAGLALVVLSVTNGAAAVRGQRALPDNAPELSEPDPARQVPYAGIAESVIAKVFADTTDPAANARRTAIHRVAVAATVIFAVGALAIVGVMLVAVMSNL